jgi:hypothetical protein
LACGLGFAEALFLQLLLGFHVLHAGEQFVDVGRYLSQSH